MNKNKHMQILSRSEGWHAIDCHSHYKHGENEIEEIIFRYSTGLIEKNEGNQQETGF